MKKTLLGLVAVLGFGLASAQSISFDKTVFDYGKVAKGSDGHRYFVVKNTGDKPLVLTEVKPSCGCTTPEWSKDPIAPGKTAKIKVGYDTNNAGNFSKIIEVFSNDPKASRSVLTITGDVVGPANTQTIEQTTIAPKVQEVSIAPAVSKRAAKVEEVKRTEAIKAK